MAGLAPSMCFNEGGADCPPIVHDTRGGSFARTRFNEGGADCPPIAEELKVVPGLSHASMKGGRTAPR